ncbi:doublecortin domain-containing protein 2B [Brachionichthys hirsutus]|uniref:doublecortin domain-containing protein 2B n=1 Tax=Brachionichthys hirsutus TaxID=412623 RepID=UPI0036050AEB
MAASTAATLLPPVKSVVVYRNGDRFYTGRRFVVNQRQVATMDAFLTEVTMTIGAPLAVRNLYTPRQGHRVTGLEELQTGAQYVAAGFEKFKKIDYLNTGTKKLPAAREETQAKVTQRPNVSAKWRMFIPVPCILHVFRNGDLLCPPFRFIIPRHMRQDLEQILSLITEKVSLRTGAVRRLCSLEGVAVASAAFLETGHCYVAVGTERFKKLPYVELWVSKAAERNYRGKRRLLRRNENRKTGNGPDDQYSDSALLDSPESDGRRVKSTGDEATATQQRRRTEGAGETAELFNRPVKVRGNRRQPRPPLSNGSVKPSVFKRAARKRREEVRGAEEVPDDENTVTELPVDQRIAEIVEDEALNEQNDLLHDTEQSHTQPSESERQDEGGHLHKHNGKHTAPPSEQDGAKDTEKSAETEETTAEAPEPELNQISLKSRPTPATSQGMGTENKAGFMERYFETPHDSPTVAKESSSKSKSSDPLLPSLCFGRSF